MTFEKISGSLGSLLLLWAAIERSARDELAHIKGAALPKSAHGIAAVLKDWKEAVVAMQPAEPLTALVVSALLAKLSASLKIRNALCHGLTGISSTSDGKPPALTWEINGGKGQIAWAELQASFSQLSKFPFAISMISRPSSKGVQPRLGDSVENRQWWLTEFALDLNEAERIFNS